MLNDKGLAEIVICPHLPLDGSRLHANPYRMTARNVEAESGCGSLLNLGVLADNHIQPKGYWREMGMDVIYTPATCLKIGGYIYLKFNQCNHAGDTW